MCPCVAGHSGLQRSKLNSCKETQGWLRVFQCTAVLIWLCMSFCSAGFGVRRRPGSTGLPHCFCWSLERSTAACEKIAHLFLLSLCHHEDIDCFCSNCCSIWVRPLYLLSHARIRESHPFTKTVIYKQQENVLRTRTVRSVSKMLIKVKVCLWGGPHE